MPGKHKTQLISWRSADPDLKPWIKAEAERRGMTDKALLDEALSEYRENTERLKAHARIYEEGGQSWSETADASYDPIPDLARLLCAAQRQDHPLPGLEFVVSHLMQGLGVPQLACSDEAEAAIRKALADLDSSNR